MIEPPPLVRINKSRHRPTAAQIAAFQGVPTGFVADAMSGTGALLKDICPLGDGRDITCVAAGPALTADNAPGDVLATLAALKFIEPGDIMMVAFGGYQGCAAAGDRILGMAKNSGAAGFVTDGPMRDYDGMVQVGLPVWCTGLTPASPFDTGPAIVGHPIQIGGRQVETGDMVVADTDGVVVVPFNRIDAVINRVAQIRELEVSLDAQVAEGRRIQPWIEELLASDKAVYD